MADELSWEAVMAWRVARQGLAQRAAADDWPAVVARICGLHAQVQSSAELTLWARVDGLDPGTVATALWTDRTLVRTWAMRGTLHLLPAEELALWVGAQGVLKPRYEMASWRKAFGMTGAEAVAVLDAIRAALDAGPLTRDELGEAVGARLGDARLGEAVRGSFGTMPKLAAFRGDVVFAKPVGQKVRFTRPDRWLDPDWRPAPHREAMAAVIRRHLAVCGPASRETFARWFGMPSAAQAGKLIAALGDAVAPVSVEGWEGWMRRDDVSAAGTSRPSGVVSLLPAFDQYVVAAPREETPVLAAEHKDRVYRRQGWLSPVLLVDGRIAGVWSHERKGGVLAVTIEPFAAVADVVRAGAEREAQRLAEYFGDELALAWEHSSLGGSVLARRARRPLLVGPPRLGVRTPEHAVEGEQPREAVTHDGRDDPAELRQWRDPARDEDLEARGAQGGDDRVGHERRVDVRHEARLRRARRQLGVHDARHHAGDLDRRAAQLGAHALAQADDEVLGGGVRRTAGEADLPRRRGDVDDVPMAARPHPRQRLLHPVHDAVDVDVHEAPRRLVGFGVEGAQRHDARVVDEHVERTELRFDGIEEAAHRRALDDVDGQRDRTVAQVGRGLLGGRHVEVADRDLHPRPDAGRRGGAADAAAGAGDRDDLALE